MEPTPIGCVATPLTVAPVPKTLPNLTVDASDWNSSPATNFSTVLFVPPFFLYLT